MFYNFFKDKYYYFVPSFSHFIFLILFVYLIFFEGNKLLYDGDTGFHIRIGEYIIEKFSVPRCDIFSFTNPPLPWIAHEWLSGVIMALIHKYSGLTGIVIFFSLVISIIYSLLFRLIKKEKGNIYITLLISLFAITSSMLHWLARPHIISLLLFLLWYSILDDFEFRQKNRLYFLPFIMILWVNLHGSFIIGFIMIAIYLAANLLRYFWISESGKQVLLKKIFFLGKIMVICIATSLINPYTYHILFFPVNLINEKFLIDYISEYQSPNFHNTYTIFFRYLLLILLLVLSASRARLNMIETLFLIVFTNMALYSVRFVTLFSIIVAPILVRQIQLILNERKLKGVEFIQKRSNNIALIDASAKGIILPIAVIMFILILGVTNKIEYGFNPERHPVEAVRFLKKVHIPGNMFNKDEIGDYIIYSAYPQYKVFIDGRLDMYGGKRLKEYFKVIRFESGWEEIIEKYEINWIIFDADSALSRFLLERKDWKLIYADKVANIFIRAIPQNQHLIEQYPYVKPVPIEKKD